MRLTNFVEGLVFTVGFLTLCLTILLGRPAPQPKLVRVPVRARRRSP